MTMILEPGVLIIRDGEGQRVAALHEGFIEVLTDKVTILAEQAEWPEEIDINRAEDAKVRAQRHMQMLDPNVNIARAEISLHKALIRIELADHVSDRK